MVRHFETKRQAKIFKESKNDNLLRVWKKIKGHKNRVKKPYVVCTYLEWLNLY